MANTKTQSQEKMVKKFFINIEEDSIARKGYFTKRVLITECGYVAPMKSASINQDFDREFQIVHFSYYDIDRRGDDWLRKINGKVLRIGYYENVTNLIELPKLLDELDEEFEKKRKEDGVPDTKWHSK